MALRAVFFDFGGTLGSLDPKIAEPWKAWSWVARELNLAIPDTEIRRVNDEADHRFGGRIYDYHGRTHEYWKVRDKWVIEKLGAATRGEEFFDALQSIFGDPSLFRPYPETPGALRKIRGLGRHMGVISNFTDALLPILEYHALKVFFDSVTYSQVVGARKPDPRLFLAALKQAGCRPAEAIHVGDSWESDYLGASRAGLTAVWLNRDERPAPHPCKEARDLRGVWPFLFVDK